MSLNFKIGHCCYISNTVINNYIIKVIMFTKFSGKMQKPASYSMAYHGLTSLYTITTLSNIFQHIGRLLITDQSKISCPFSSH